MAEFAYPEALRVLSADASADLGRLLAATCAPACDPVVYLADFSRLVLLPLTAGLPAEQVEGTLPGRAFTTGEPAVSARDGYARVWVPVLEQAARAGVLAVSLPDADADSVRQAEMLGVFAGLALSSMNRVTDAPRVHRHGRSMSLPASMQWDLLPPWAIRMPGAVIAGILEPAYDIAGDAYDYAAGDGVLHFALIDGMGHGIGSTLLADLAVGAYRHARRAGAPAQAVHTAIDEALASGYDDLSFATGLIGRLTAATGRLEWTCAGHPAPLLLRGRKVVAELECEATVPFGLGTGTPAVCSRDLEPDDAVLLYTDGVTEAHAPGGEWFGLDRLADLLERESAGTYQPEELLRRLVRAVLDHQGGHLRDDATLLLVRWTGP
jgi:serine phosphatase RsbU (regulator of sigma subunit)